MPDQDNSTVVVFGGAGYIGSMLVRELLDEGYTVRVFDNMLYGEDGVRGLSHPKLNVINADICDVKSVSDSVIGSDAVILLAGIVGRRLEDTKRKTTRDINLLASSVIVDAALEHGASRFIFTSSDAVYGQQSGLIYETAIPEPVSLYSRLKLRMEERVLNTRRRNFYPTVLRIANCHGYSPRMRFDMLGNDYLRDAIFKKHVVIDNGEKARAFIHVQDAARAILTCLTSHFNLVGGEIFNVCAADQNLTMRQVANVVKSLVPDVQIEIKDQEADLTDYLLSTSKIAKVLDFRTKWTLEQSLSHLRDKIVEGAFEDPYSIKYSNT